MPLHHAKRTALLQLCNCISRSDLTNLKELANGEFFENIILASFKGCVNAEQSKAVCATSVKVKDDKKDSEDEKIDSISNSVIESEEENKKNSDVAEIKDADLKNEIGDIDFDTVESDNDVILKRFQFVQSFIDEKYDFKSDDMISYSACIQANEFELAKVALFVLSEVVKHFIDINKAELSTLVHLDVRVQEDLEECFSLFISDRESLSLKAVEKIISNHAKYKSPSSSKSPFVTPRRSCASKYRIDTATSPLAEDIYTNSPLKSFFESPVFKKEDIMKKEKEIVRTQKKFQEAELRAEDYEQELKKTQKILKQKEDEIKILKKEMKKRESDMLKNEVLKNEGCGHDKEMKDLQMKIKRLEDEKEELELENADYFQQLRDRERQEKLNNIRKNYGPTDTKMEENLLEFENRNEKLEKQLEFYKGLENRFIMEKTEFEEQIKSKKEEIEMLKALLDEQYQALENEFPSSPENIGVIIEEENNDLRLKLKEAELKIEELEKNLQSVVMAHSEQNDVPKLKTSFDLMEVSEDPEKHSEKKEELTVLQDECEMSCNSEVASKHSATSNHSEVVSDTANASLPIEKLGGLWDKFSQNENTENTDSAVCMDELNTPENNDTVDNSSYTPSCLPGKNGYKSYAQFKNELMKISKEHAHQLEKKDEDIEKLNSNIVTLQQQCQVHLTELENDKKTIEELKQQLEESERKCSIYSSKYLKLQKKWKTDHENFELYKEHLKTTIASKEMENSVLKQRMEKKLNSQREKYQKEMEVIEGQLEYFKERLGQVEILKKRLHERVEKLEKDKKMIFEKLNVTEENFSEKVIEYQRLENLRRRFWRSSILEEAKTSTRLDYPPPDQNVSAVRDANESTLPGALYNTKNGLQFVSSEEPDFLNHSSLEEIRRDCPDDRVQELSRRNSTLPRHLRSTYPVESNLTPTASKFFGTYRQGGKNGTGESSHYNSNPLKRKYKEVDPDLSQSGCPATPVSKFTKKLNASFHKYLSFDRANRTGPVRARPT